MRETSWPLSKYICVKMKRTKPYWADNHRMTPYGVRSSRISAWRTNSNKQLQYKQQSSLSLSPLLHQMEKYIGRLER